jgi:hypothetical protein
MGSILKCSLAYFIASLGTFNKAFSSILGQGDGHHLVATIAVYFHPARTVGSMFEANIFAFVGVLFSCIMCVVSMGVASIFEDIGKVRLGRLIILAVICTGTTAVIAYAKQKLNKPTCNTACSLSALVYFRWSVVNKGTSF